jgi:hypothetical protein
MKHFLYSVSLVLLLTVSINKDQSPRTRIFDVSKAFAATYIDPSSMDVTTPSGFANYARYTYYLVNGDSEEYYSDAGAGFLGMVNNFTAADGFGGVMAGLGYETCNDIPTSGSATVNDDGMNIGITFKAGTHTVPSHFGSDAGQTYTKGIAIKLNGTTTFNMEFKCDAASTVVSGYLLLDYELLAGAPTKFEISFQKDTSTNAVYLDFVTVQGIKMIARFATANGVDFKLYQVFINNGGGGGNALAVRGELNGKNNVNYLKASNTSGSAATTVIHDASSASPSGADVKKVQCLDMNTNSTTSGCTAIPDPGTLSSNSSSYTFSIASMNSITLPGLVD